MKTIFPPFLKEGDKVTIVTPASKIDDSLLRGAMTRLSEWQLRPSLSKHAAGANGLFSGTVEERLHDLQRALDDKDVKAILCSRGGYGTVHLVDKLDFTVFRQYPKWIIGFSDITVLHNLAQLNGVASLHAPMAKQFLLPTEKDFSLKSLKDILFGELPHYQIPVHRYNHTGKIKGTLRGGNFSVFNGLRGTSYDIPYKGTILFLEDVSERPHVVERMMYNLKLGGLLDKLSGLIIGQFTDYNEDYSLGKDLYADLADMFSDYDYPICFNFPIGHGDVNYPLIEGAQVEFDVGKKEVGLSFIKV